MVIPGVEKTTKHRFLLTRDKNKLTTPGDDEARVGVADPGVPAPHQGVGDAVRAQLTQSDSIKGTFSRDLRWELLYNLRKLFSTVIVAPS